MQVLVEKSVCATCMRCEQYHAIEVSDSGGKEVG
jgi:hypothetical protein